MYTWDALKRQCEVSKDIVDNYRQPCLNREFLREEQKNFHSPKILVFLHGRITWWVMQRSVWERYCELANKTTQQLYKVSTPWHR